MNQDSQSFWSLSVTELLARLQATVSGLRTDEASERLTRYGANRLKPSERSDVLTLPVAQFKSPIILIPMGNVFGFSPLSFSTYLLLLLIVVAYIIVAEITKTVFYKKVKF